MSRHSSIHSWPASYYVSSDRRWDSGVLSLTRTTLLFTSSHRRRKREEPQGEEEEGEVLLNLRLSRIMEIKMESSSFIFSTLTVLEEGNLKHWFGSLKPNRLVVYNVLEHFWRERLLSAGDPQARSAEAPPSKGKELLSLVAGAQRRMEDAGMALSQQGEQFDNMMQGLGKMDSDLGVADRLLSQLESPSWWPFGKLPWTSQQQVKAEVKAEAGASARNKVLVSIPAVVSRGGQSDLKPGCLLVLLSSLEVRDSSCQLLQRFQRSDIDEIRVHSPYEISLRQRFIGRPDVCFRLLSAKMPEALSLLEMQYKKKVEFTREYAAFRATPLSSPSGAESNPWSQGEAHSPQDHEVPLEVPAGELSQIQVQVLQPTVSQAEAQELRQMLLQLKSLALEAEGELERQDEVLEELTTSTERATLNIDRHTSRMRRLL